MSSAISDQTPMIMRSKQYFMKCLHQQVDDVLVVSDPRIS